VQIRAWDGAASSIAVLSTLLAGRDLNEGGAPPAPLLFTAAPLGKGVCFSRLQTTRCSVSWVSHSCEAGLLHQY
jgi:hypothetical protein